MKVHLTYIAIIVLLITVYFLDRKTQRLQKQLKEKEYNVLQVERDSIQSELRRSLMERNRLDNRLDSLLHVSSSIQLSLDKANEKLKAIPGKYDKLTNKELQDKMIQRWQQRKGN